MKNSAPLRVGVIGLGQIALKAHLPGYEKASGCRLTALYSSRESVARQTAVQYGIPTIFKDWKKLLVSSDVDAVSICTPNSTHAPIALEALKRGKHVLVEKPMAISVAEASAMERLARKKRRVLMPHHNMRFDPAVRAAQRLLSKGAIGNVFAFACSLAHRGPSNWNPDSKWFFNVKTAGGGALMDLGAHMFDSLQFLLGDKPSEIHASAPGIEKRGVGESHCACLLKWKGGLVGTLTLSWVDTDYHNRFYFFGSTGTLFLNLGVGEPLVLERRKNRQRILPPLPKDVFKPSIYQHFVDCIRTGQEPWVSPRAGLAALRIIEAGYQSIRRGKPVSV
ncbi:MAG: Gfo/Idh/MocA family protein [bacterium]